MGFAEVPLKQGAVTLIDEADLPLISGARWHAYHNGNGLTTYAKSYSMGLMHRAILQPPSHLEVDHINGNGLDNRRSNLRLATKAQNQANRRPSRTNTSGFKGVSPHAQVRKWKAEIRVAGVRHYLGLFNSPEEAAQAYDCAAFQHFGEYARLNFPRVGA